MKNKYVTPELYEMCLRWISWRDGLEESTFAPAQLADIFAVEEELGESLPGSYEEHLLHLGSGQEYGGLATWLHIDLAKSGNILAEDQPSGFLPIYDSHEGELFGYYRNGSPFSERIFVWEGEGSTEECFSSLGEFYRDRLDCTDEEIEEISSEGLDSLVHKSTL